MKYFIITSLLFFGPINANSLHKAETLQTNRVALIDGSTFDIETQVAIADDINKVFDLYPNNKDRVPRLAEKLNLNKEITVCETPNRWNVISFYNYFDVYRIFEISNSNHKYISFTYQGYGYVAYNECDPADAILSPSILELPNAIGHLIENDLLQIRPVKIFKIDNSTLDINLELLIKSYVEGTFPTINEEAKRVKALSQKLNDVTTTCEIPNRWNVIAFHGLYPDFRITHISNPNYIYISFTFYYGYMAYNECDPAPESTTTSTKPPTTTITTTPTTKTTTPTTTIPTATTSEPTGPTGTIVPTETTEPTKTTLPTKPTEPTVPTMHA